MKIRDRSTLSLFDSRHTNADRVADIESAFDDGRLYLLVDDERSVGDQSFIGRNHRWDVRGAIVHVISRPAGGEIRGYVRIDGRLHLRVPCTPLNWDELDAVVARRLALPVIARAA